MLNRYHSELAGHIQMIGRMQQLDEFAVNFISAKRKEHPVVIRNDKAADEFEQLKKDKEALLIKLAQVQDQVIQLQNEQMALATEKTRAVTLLEEHTKTVQGLQVQLDKAQADTDALRSQLADAEADARSYVKTWFGFYRKMK